MSSYIELSDFFLHFMFSLLLLHYSLHFNCSKTFFTIEHPIYLAWFSLSKLRWAFVGVRRTLHLFNSPVPLYNFTDSMFLSRVFSIQLCFFLHSTQNFFINWEFSSMVVTWLLYMVIDRSIPVSHRLGETRGFLLKLPP